MNSLGCADPFFLLHYSLLCRTYIYHTHDTVSVQAYHVLYSLSQKSFEDYSQKHNLEPDRYLTPGHPLDHFYYGDVGPATKMLTFYLLLTMHRIAWSRVGFRIRGWIILINVDLFSDNFWAQFCHIKHTNSFQGLIFFVQLEVQECKQ